MYRRIGSTLLRNTTLVKQVLSPRWQSVASQPVAKQSSSDLFETGSVYEGFELQRQEYVQDFNMTAYLFRHQGTGSEYLHVHRDDPNNVFSINFRTTPFDSTGLPHILEHSVLCGSQRYPVRDPLFKMLNRSMATFMNAMTGPDYTLYPFSSMNETDYRNLQKIYLDAVFKPNLQYLDFRQEGWRLENAELSDPSSPLTFKGVVYNEMKGAFSENASVFGQKFFNQMLPDHTYGHVSGGEPLDIPQLTHEDLVRFHAKYYHPSNAKFFSYGNFPLLPTLKYVHDNYLDGVQGIESQYSAVPAQKRWTGPRKSEISCRFDNMGAPIEKQNQIAVGYLMSDITDSYETFVLYILTELLVKGPNAYFYKRLVEPNFSGGFNGVTGFDSQIKDTMFIVGLQDLAAEDFARFESLVASTIDEAIEQGFQQDHVDSVLHNVELLLRHQTPKFGLGLLFNVTPLWNHNGDVIATFHVNRVIERLRENMQKDGKYLQDRVRHYFKENAHRLTMTMQPDLEFEQKFNAAEQAVLAKKVAALSEQDRLKVYADARQLAENQRSTTEDMNVLPCLTLDDVKVSKDEKLKLERIALSGGVKGHIVTADTNGVTYFKALANAGHLSRDEQLLLPLLTEVFDQFGTERYSYAEFDNAVKSKTQGLSLRLHCSESIADANEYEVGVEFGSFCLDKNTPAMFELFRELFQSSRMDDVSRFEMLLENYMSNLTVGVANSGHLYAMQAASGLVTEAGALKETLSGIAHIDYMKRLVAEKSSAEILSQLKALGERLFSSNSQLRCGLNVGDSFKTQAVQELDRFLGSVSAEATQQQWHGSKVLPAACRHNVMTIPVNYCAKSFVAVPYLHEDFAPLRVLAKVLSAKYLLPVVREQNGAYGAGAKLNVDGKFTFFSYRDPHSRKTLDTFDSTCAWARDYLVKCDDQGLFEAKLGVLQQLDAPVAPGVLGDEDFKLGLREEQFQQHRSRILDTTVGRLQEVTEKYFAEERSDGVAKVVIGPENKDLAAGDEKWTVSSSEK